MLQFQRLTTLCCPSSRWTLYDWLTPSRPAPSMQQATVQPVEQECGDYDVARHLQTLNYSSCPGGYLPVWQQQYHVYQPRPHTALPTAPATQGRSYSAPLPVIATSATHTAASSDTSVIDTAGHMYGTVQATRTDVSSGGQTDCLQVLMNYSGIPATDASCDIDVDTVK